MTGIFAAGGRIVSPRDRASDRACAGSKYVTEGGGNRYSGRCRHDAVAGPSGAGTSSKNAGEMSISTDGHTSDSYESHDVLARLEVEKWEWGGMGATNEMGELRGKDGGGTGPTDFSGTGGALRDGINNE